MTAHAVEFYTRWTELMRAWGETVVWVDGCQDRGASASFYDPTGGFWEHHDASTELAGNWGSIGIITNGRGGKLPVPGPLANLQFARDGQVAVVAMGVGNHAGTGGPLLGIPANDANRHTTGAEVANDGLGEPYSAALTRALIHGEAAWAICADRTADYVRGHKEWAPGRKSDPRLSMDDRRAAVAAVISNGGPLAARTQEDDDMRDDERQQLFAIGTLLSGPLAGALARLDAQASTDYPFVIYQDTDPNSDHRTLAVLAGPGVWWPIPSQTPSADYLMVIRYLRLAGGIVEVPARGWWEFAQQMWELLGATAKVDTDAIVAKLNATVRDITPEQMAAIADAVQNEEDAREAARLAAVRDATPAT